MAALYGVDADQALPTRGLTHGLELVWRLAARDGLKVQAPDAEPYAQLAALYARPAADAGTAAVVIRALSSPEAAAEMAERIAPALLVVDEGMVEFAEAPSAAAVVNDHANLIVLRSLSLAYGLAGARVGAALAQAQTLARLAEALEPYALPEVSVRLAMQALDPSRMMETAERISAVRRERARVAEALSRIMALEAGVGPVIVARPSDPEGAAEALRRYGLAADLAGERVRLPVSLKPEVNDRLLTALGAATPARGATAPVRLSATPRRRASSAPSIWTAPGR
ncbi:aminotransferase class I/II-fold pyridoxal phosphate-dependent enzyme [Brevundimonas sp. LF-1]|uniref:aminotransferase class I/II-fold pyridoxal phosphate-dependent enzyme n=1 Tax=Brevundimonas sp. LF-1 TaxID=3126100 RepID=UPI0030E5BC78